MPELAELLAWAKLIAGLLVLFLVVSVGFNLGMLSRVRELERRLEPTVADMAGFLRGVRAVRRVKQTRRAQRDQSMTRLH